MAQVNWNQIKKDAGDFTPLPPGKYDAFVESAELKSAASGNEYYKLKFKVQSGPHAGRVLYNNVVLSVSNPNALRAFFINMQALGITQDQVVNSGSSTEALVPMLQGRQAMLTTSLQEYQGQMRENVDRMERHSGGPMARGAGAAMIASPAAASVPTAAPVPSPAPVPAPTPAPAAAAPSPAPQPAPVPTPPAATQPTEAAPVSFGGAQQAAPDSAPPSLPW